MPAYFFWRSTNIPACEQQKHYILMKVSCNHTITGDLLYLNSSLCQPRLSALFSCRASKGDFAGMGDLYL